MEKKNKTEITEDQQRQNDADIETVESVDLDKLKDIVGGGGHAVVVANNDGWQ